MLVDTGGQVKLLDFGIATLLEKGSTGEPSTLTQAAGPALTPEHAAPEQAVGGVVTTATDVYALGVLLYQLLVGRHPTAPDDDPTHVGDSSRARRARAARGRARSSSQMSPDDTVSRRILKERGSTRDRLARACRGDIDTIVAKALKKSPAERYQTVTALADDIRRHLRSEPVAARPDSVWYRTRKFAARHRIEIGAAAAIVVALLAGTGIAVSQARRSAAERDRALELLRRAEATNDFSNILMSQATPRGRPISNIELLAEGEKVIARRFAADRTLRVHMLLSLAARHQENQQFDEWQRILKRAHAESRTIGDVGLRAYTTCAWALSLTERGDPAEALALITGALPTVASNPDYVEYESGCRVFESIAARMAGDAPRAVVAAETRHRPGGGPPRRAHPRDRCRRGACSGPGQGVRLRGGGRRVSAHRRDAGEPGPGRHAAHGGPPEQLERDDPRVRPDAEGRRRRRTRGAGRALGRFRTRRLTHDADDLRGRALHDGQPRRGDSGLRRGAGEGSCGRLTAAIDQPIGARHRRGVCWR